MAESTNDAIKTEAGPASPTTPSISHVLDSALGMRLLAASPDCVKLIDVEGNVQYMNENGLAHLEIDDYTKVHAQPWRELWPDDLRAEVDAAVADARAGGNGRFTGFCLTAKGTPKYWDVAVSPIHENSGRLLWLLSVSRDITQQKRAEKALRSSEERFRALADNIAQLAWMADGDGSIFWYNKRWYELTGTTLEEMKGWGWMKVHHPGHVDRVVAKISECFTSGTAWEDTFPLRCADGTYRWFLSRAMPMMDENGNVVLWCGTNTDVTEVRAASQRLRQLARLVELSHEAISVRSLTGAILLWNRGCEELYGYTRAEALGSNPHELLQTENALSSEALEELLKSEGTWSGELSRTDKEGRQVWVDSRKQVIKLDDENVVLESDRDITERKKADEVRKLLVGELNHRVKNTLAIVQSLASQTGRTASSVEDFVQGFAGRLQSLANAHNVLTDTAWRGTHISDLIQSQIETLSGDGSRVKTSGPDVVVPPQAALQLALILHELATNATKHGALKSPQGHAAIEWDVRNESDQCRLRLTWREMGGQPVHAPTRRGFGLSLMERTGCLPHFNINTRFEETGLVCEIDADVAPAGDTADQIFDPSKSHGNAPREPR